MLISAFRLISLIHYMDYFHLRKKNREYVYIAVRIRLLKQNGEPVLMEQPQHYCLVNIGFKLTSDFRNKNLRW